METDNVRFSQLSSPRQTLVRACQKLNFGELRLVCVRHCQPVFNPAPAMLVEKRLDLDDTPRPEAELADFVLCGGVRRLLEQLDDIRDGVIESIEVRAGVPRRIVFHSPLPEAVA